MHILIFIIGCLLGYLVADKFKSNKLSSQLKAELSSLSRQSLLENNQEFLKLAGNQFNSLQNLANQDLKNQKTQIQSLIDNIEKNLHHHQKFVHQVEKQNLDQLSKLSSNLQSLMQSEKELTKTTKSLETALRSNQAVGSWGEIQLSRILELAGLKKYVDYQTQATITAENGSSLRPDLILNLPNQRVVIIDSKAPLSNYLKSIETQQEQLKARFIKTFISDFKKHIQDLEKKQYQKEFQHSAPFVIMFVPNDNLFSVALDHSSDLLDFAMSKNVVIATPSTLLAMLLLIEKSWQDQKLSEQIQAHYKEGATLIDRIKTFVSHIQHVGKGLQSANNAFNKIQGSYERSVLPQMRKFKNLRDQKSTTDDLDIPNITQKHLTN